jgi:hypothetical protein
MRATLSITALALAAAAAAPSVAHGSSAFRDAGPVGGAVVSDGVRWAAIERPDATVTLIDTRTGLRRTVTPPARCAIGAGAGMGLGALGGGALAWQCAPDQPGATSDAPEPLLYDIPSRQWTRPDAVAARWRGIASSSASSVSFAITGVGRRWLSAWSSGYHWHSVDLFARAGDTAVSTDSGGAGAAPDLDAAGGFTVLCHPLARPTVQGNDAYDVGPRLGAYEYDRPFGLSTEAPPLVLDRCGAKSRRLTRIGEAANSPQLGAGIVTWLGTAGRVFVHNARSGRTHALRVPTTQPAEVVHTRTQIVVKGARRAFLARVPAR